MNKSNRITDMLLPVISVMFVLALWWFASAQNDVLAGPVETLERFIELIEHPKMGIPLYVHVLSSFYRIMVAFIFASVIGVSLGVAFGVLPTFKRIMWPVFSILRPLPPLAWIPLIVLWVGTSGDASKIIIIFIGIVMAVIINTFAGISHTDEMLLDAGRTLGASKWQILTDITLPNSIPVILAGLKTGLSTGWMSLVAAEMMVVDNGIGFLINDSMQYYDTALDFVGIILVALSSSLLTLLLNLLERRLCPWLYLQSK